MRITTECLGQGPGCGRISRGKAPHIEPLKTGVLLDLSMDQFTRVETIIASQNPLSEQASDVALVNGLRLDIALNLLQQAGWEAPASAPSGSLAWLQAIIDGLCDVSSRDALTGLANRRQFEAAINREVDRVARNGEPALLLTLDIDHFKRVNDTHGHAAGDEVIKAVAASLQDCVRPMDTVARVGGRRVLHHLAQLPARIWSNRGRADSQEGRGTPCGDHRRRGLVGHRQHWGRVCTSVGAIVGGALE